MSSSVSPEPQPVVAIATGVAVTTMNEEVTVVGLLAGQPSTRLVQVRRSSLQPPGFELQTYWPVREGLNAPRHGTPQVVHTCASLTSHLDLASRQDASYDVSHLPLGWFRTVASTSPQLVANSTTLA